MAPALLHSKCPTDPLLHSVNIYMCHCTVQEKRKNRDSKSFKEKKTGTTKRKRGKKAKKMIKSGEKLKKSSEAQDTYCLSKKNKKYVQQTNASSSM